MNIPFLTNVLGTQSIQATKQTSNETSTKLNKVTKQTLGSTDTTGGNTSFKGILNETLGSNVVENQESSKIENAQLPTNQLLTNDQLLDLKAFLQTTDLMQLDGGIEVLEQILLSDEIDLESLLANFLQIPKEELLQQLSNVLQIPESELKDLLTQITNEEQTNLHLEQLLQNLFSQQDLKLATPMNEQTAVVLKAVKLIELIVENKQLTTDSTTKQENKFIQAALEKVNEMLANQQIARASYLNQTFSKLVTDLSQSSTEKETNSLLVGQATINNNSLQWNTFDLTNAAKSTKTNTEQLLQQFQSILAKGNLSTVGNTQKMLIRLYPENLGSLRIELIQKDDGLIARILTSTSQAKDLLDSQLNVLRQAFSMQNIQVDKLEINQSFMQQQNYLTKDQTKDQNQSQGKEEQLEEETNFALSLEELLNEEVII